MLSSSLLSCSLFLNLPLQAVIEPDEEKDPKIIQVAKYPVFREEDKKRILRRATHTTTKKPTFDELSQNLRVVYETELDSSLKDFSAFIQSPEFVNFLVRHPHRRQAFNRLAIQRSVMFEAREDLSNSEEIKEHPLFLTLCKQFGDHLSTVQKNLNRAIDKALELSYKNFSAQTKKYILRRATRTKTKTLTADKLAGNLAFLYEKIFRRNLEEFITFIQSPEFTNFLVNHPQHSDAFSEIATFESTLFHASVDVMAPPTTDNSLEQTLFGTFGIHLDSLKETLKDVIKASEKQKREEKK